MLLTLENLTIEQDIEQESSSFTERKRQGLFKRNTQKAEYILEIEGLWETFALEFDREARAQRLDRLLEALRFTIQRQAGVWANTWKNKKIPPEEFEYEFWITAWMLCEENYNHYTPFYLYETLLLALERKGIDIVRKYTKTKKRALNTNSLPLLTEADSLYPSNEDIEKEITDRILVQQMIDDPLLTEQERALLNYMYEGSNEECSFRQVADVFGLKHPQTVSRSLKKIQRKLAKYREYASIA